LTSLPFQMPKLALLGAPTPSPTRNNTKHTSAEGVLLNLPANEMLTNRFAERVLPDLSAKGVLPNRFAEGVLPKLGTHMICKGSKLNSKLIHS